MCQKTTYNTPTKIMLYGCFFLGGMLVSLVFGFHF